MRNDSRTCPFYFQSWEQKMEFCLWRAEKKLGCEQILEEITIWRPRWQQQKNPSYLLSFFTEAIPGNKLIYTYKSTQKSTYISFLLIYFRVIIKAWLQKINLSITAFHQVPWFYIWIYIFTCLYVTAKVAYHNKVYLNTRITQSPVQIVI